MRRVSLINVIVAALLFAASADAAFAWSQTHLEREIA
jgi:hypothetical protein